MKVIELIAMLRMLDPNMEVCIAVDEDGGIAKSITLRDDLDDALYFKGDSPHRIAGWPAEKQVVYITNHRPRY